MIQDGQRMIPAIPPIRNELLENSQGSVASVIPHKLNCPGYSCNMGKRCQFRQESADVELGIHIILYLSIYFHREHVSEEKRGVALFNLWPQDRDLKIKGMLLKKTARCEVQSTSPDAYGSGRFGE